MRVSPRMTLPKQHLSLSLFFPAYNEEKNIAESVRAAKKVLEQVAGTYEIIIVNDGSSDRTGDRADALSLKDPHVRVIHQENQGYGGAVWAGIQRARYDYIFFTDADLQFDLAELPKLLAYIPEHPVVLGYRAKRRDPFMRLVNAYGWNKLNRIFFGLRVKDIDCAFKLLRRDLVQSLPTPSKSAMMSAEILIRLQRRGILFKEVPVTHLPRTAGSPTGAKPAVIAQALRAMWNLFWGDLGSTTAQQLLRFGAVGIANTALDLSLYTILTRTVGFFALHLLLAKTCSFLAGTVLSFTLNRAWTFKETGRVRALELARFYATAGASVAINVASLYLFHSLFGLFDLVSVVLATIVTFTWNFVLAKLWVFAGTRTEMRHA